MRVIRYFLLVFGMSLVEASFKTKPHIFLIVADDMGFDDISVHGADQIPTPNIDGILSYGITLNDYHTAPMCTPARSSLMTGKYAASAGMQHYVIVNTEPWGLSLDDRILPEYLKEVGYSTHLVGKWHLGHYERERTPNQRGFDSFHGCYGGYIDYYNHTAKCMTDAFPCEPGYDIRNNFDVAYDTLGEYATHLFTRQAIDTIHKHDKSNPLFLYLTYTAPHAADADDPLQVPEEIVERFNYIADPKRRQYAAMVSDLDDSIGNVVQAIKDRGMLDNSIIIFISDNGAPIQGLFANSGSNFPFRGQKNSPWEGAVRVPAGLWSPHLVEKQRVSHQMFHVSDWLPTIAHMAGFEPDDTIDGHDMWSALSTDAPSPRQELLVNVDNDVSYISYIYKKWKYINGTTANGLFDGWLSENDRTERNPLRSDYGQTVSSSKVGRALAPFSRNKRSPTVFLGSGRPQMTVQEINEHRQDAQITCNKVPHQTDAKFKCNPVAGPCLFNIRDDPCERRNLFSMNPPVLGLIEKRVEYFIESARRPRNRAPDPDSNPRNFNDTWASWYDFVFI